MFMLKCVCVCVCVCVGLALLKYVLAVPVVALGGFVELLDRFMIVLLLLLCVQVLLPVRTPCECAPPSSLVAVGYGVRMYSALLTGLWTSR